MNLEQVMPLWGCHRITTLRLMERGVLQSADRIVALPIFERAQIKRVGNSRIADDYLPQRESECQRVFLVDDIAADATVASSTS